MSAAVGRASVALQEAVALGLSSARYVPLGRTAPNFDCWGLVLAGLKDLGQPVPIDPMRAASTAGGVRAIVEGAYRPEEWRQVGGPCVCVVFFPSLKRTVHAGLGLEFGVIDISERQGVRFRRWAELGQRYEGWVWAGSQS